MILSKLRGMNVGTRVRLDLINQKRVTILVVDPKNATVYVDEFSSQGYTVEVATDPSNMYAMLCENGPPGFLMISNQFESAMAKMMPEFCVKRFKIPIFLFRETMDLPAPEMNEKMFGPDIVPLEDASPANLLKNMENFEQICRARLAAKVEKEMAANMKDEGAPAAEPGPPSESVNFENRSPDQILVRLKENLNLRDVLLEAQDVLTLHSCKVSNAAGRGYFIFAFPVRDKDHQTAPSLETIKEIIGEVFGSQVQIEDLGLPVPEGFFSALLEGADELASGTLGPQELFLVYYRNKSDVEEPEVRMIGDNFLIPMEEWWTRLPLPVHTYVYFERNQKRLLYIRPGSSLRREAFRRFQRKGFIFLAVDPVDFASYRKIRELVHVSNATGESSAIATAA